MIVCNVLRWCYTYHNRKLASVTYGRSRTKDDYLELDYGYRKQFFGKCPQHLENRARINEQGNFMREPFLSHTDQSD